MKTNNEIGIIGAAGKTGIRVHNLLKRLGYSVRGMSRSTKPAFNWNSPEQWENTLQGIKTLYVTYQPDLAVSRAEADIKHLIHVAKNVGIEHLILLSGRGEEGAELAEQQIINSGLSWNVVRASWFMQNFSESFMLDGVLAREMILPRAQAKEPFIDVDDISEVVVKTITDKNLSNQLFEITGPELLSFDECIAHISLVIGEEISYLPIPVDAYIAKAQENGMPDDIAWLMKELFTEVLDGSNAFTTTTISDVLGRPPRTFKEYVKKAMASGVWSVNTPITTAKENPIIENSLVGES